MSVIAERPLTVAWSLNGNLYMMMELRPDDMRRMKGPEIEGIPVYYAIVDDDVVWWPQCRDGQPVLGYDHG